MKKTSFRYKYQLHEGREVEKEHKRTYQLVKRRKCKLSPQKFYSSIAKDHIREFPTYYTALEKMEKGLKKKAKTSKTRRKTYKPKYKPKIKWY